MHLLEVVVVHAAALLTTYLPKGHYFDFNVDGYGGGIDVSVDQVI